MKVKGLIIFSLIFFFSVATSNFILAEDKPSGGVIPKLPKTASDPELSNGHVYPEWGPVCQRYTYSVVYRDKDGRKPEYVKIYFNGKMIDMDPAFAKATAGKEDYQKGVRYEYKFVPNKIDSNFYYFEASNGLGKTRDSIIDSPDNGPVLFESAFDKNEIVLIDPSTGDVVWRYSTGKEWIGGVALSDDGQYLAALTSQHVYLFSTDNNKPLWQYEFNQSSPIGGGPRGNGIAISSDGSRIAAATGMEVALFDRNSNKPLWKYQAPALAVAISKDGQYLAASAVKQDKEKGGNVVLFWEAKNNQPIREFGADSNFHDVSLSANGQYLVASTGCPDRKAYLFSKDNPKPLVQSDRLTYDSPVSKSKISADGSLAAFATEGGPDSSVVVLFSKDSTKPLWKFDNQKQNSSRAMSITADGQFIAAATMRGDVYLLSKNSDQPVKSWQLDSSIGALDIADDGSFLALGGSDKKVWILPKNGGEKKIPVNEFIQTIDVAGNGKYVAVGTGGSVYFFESYLSPDKNKTFPCTSVIEPPPIEQAMGDYGGEGKQTGDFIGQKLSEKKLPQTLAEGLALAGTLAAAYWLMIRFAEKFSLTHPLLMLITLPMAVMLWNINRFQFNFQTITDFCASAFSFWTLLLLISLRLKIPKVFYLTGALYFAVLSTITLVTYQPFFSLPTLVHLTEAIFGFGYLSGFFKDKKRIIFLGVAVLALFSAYLFYQSKGSVSFKKQEEAVTVPTDQTSGEKQPEGVSAPSGKAVCGNNLCEPDLGETKENCPKDCSAGD